jgi:pimeloyl-ACP methyl ester carboxylesterase
MMALTSLLTPSSLAGRQRSSISLVEQIPYDEFSFFQENAEEWGLPFHHRPDVARVAVELEGGRSLSALAWGEQPSSLILLHGGAQNAHTYDTVALALERPLLALDLPGHGHSDAPAEGMFEPSSMAQDVAHAIAELGAPPVTLVGMSLGGLVALHVAHDRPDLVARVAFIDITPGVNQEKAGHITAFINGPEGFEQFDDLLARTKEFNPTRSEASLRRGILHNAIQLDDGTWVWRWAQHRRAPVQSARPSDELWNLVGELTQPALLVRGMSAGSVVDDADESEFFSRLPSAQVIHVEGAGHSVQGDQPVVLSSIIDEFVASSS